MLCGERRDTYNSAATSMVHEPVARVRLSEIPRRIISLSSIGRVDEEIQRPGLIHIHPQYRHRQKLPLGQEKTVVLRISPCYTLRDVRVAIRPPGIGGCVCPEESVVVGRFAERDAVVSFGAVEISFQHDGVGRGVGLDALIGEGVAACGGGLEVDVRGEGAFDVDVGGVVVEARGVGFLGAAEVLRVFEAKVLHSGRGGDDEDGDLTGRAGGGGCVEGCGGGVGGCGRGGWGDYFDFWLAVGENRAGSVVAGAGI